MVASARNRGSLEMRISPANGLSSSMMRNIAPDIEKTDTSKVVIAKELRGARTLKLRKITTSHMTRTTSNGREMYAPAWATSNARSSAICVANVSALVFKAFCVSSRGERL